MRYDNILAVFITMVIWEHSMGQYVKKSLSEWEYNEFLELIREFQSKEQCHEPVEHYREELLKYTDHPEVIYDYAISDMPVTEIADISLMWQNEWPVLSREQLTSLVEKIMSGEGTEAENTIDVMIFSANCKHPGGSGLIFWPEQVYGENVEPTVEQIVDTAMTGEV